MLKVAKFGGSSLSDAGQIKKVIDIIKSDPSRRVIVVSAPGKRTPTDARITALLIRYWGQLQQRQDEEAEKTFAIVAYRFLEIASKLNAGYEETERLLNSAKETSRRFGYRDWILSWGEHLMGVIMAAALQYRFINPFEFISFNAEGDFDLTETKWKALSIGLTGKEIRNAVIPGFYGRMPDGRIKLFPPNGSDITASIVAELTDANYCENWTDTSGILMADPAIVPNPKTIDSLTYEEAMELAYRGASVLHPDAIAPVRRAKIPLNVRNTNSPEHPGTMIHLSDKPGTANFAPGKIIGIAGRKEFTAITLRKAGMNREIGFVRRLCEVLEKHRVSFEHMPSGIDEISVIIDEQKLKPCKDSIIRELNETCQPESVEVENGLALICVVGKAMVHTAGIAGKLFSALGGASINVRTINQGASETNVVIGVANADYEKATGVLYDASVEKE